MSLKSTHEVLNQVPPLEGYNPYAHDAALQEGLFRSGASWAQERLSQFGQQVGSEQVRQWGFQANENGPRLRTHDRFGNRLDVVEFHPAWHELMKLGVQAGVHSQPWSEPRPGAHAARAASLYLLSQAEAGVGCPLSMTYSAVPALRAQPEVAAEWEPRLTSTQYDPRSRPASSKTGSLCGMAMTEKQGGSDVRSNTTRAVPVGAGGPGAEYLLTGHKWFCSAPMNDAFLMLAQAGRGLSCFLVPRFLPDGTRNALLFQRLKDKLGNRSNASSEVELDGAWGRMLGDEGRGVPTIIEMVSHTRLDCVIGSAAALRQAVSQAVHHATHRSAFGKRLADQPLMRNVLADLGVEAEAATVLMMRLASSYDARGGAEERAFSRLATAVGKYWVCKRAVAGVAEALECLGGNGFVEESLLPRLYRDVPLNSIWEGSGNVICLDVLRALQVQPATRDVFFAELRAARGAEKRLDRWVSALERELDQTDSMELRARHCVERMALALQGALLVQHGHPAVAEAFCASRLSGAHGMQLGTLPTGLELEAVLERARPVGLEAR